MAPIVGQEAHSKVPMAINLPEVLPDLIFMLPTHLLRCRKQLSEVGVLDLHTYEAKPLLPNTLIRCIDVYATAMDVLYEDWMTIATCLIQTFADRNEIRGQYNRSVAMLQFAFTDGHIFCN